jgi:hypothetical protein
MNLFTLKFRGSSSWILRTAANRLLNLMACALVGMMFAANSHATVMVFTIPPNTTVTTGLGTFAVGASAEFDFDPSAHTITLYLLNLVSNPAAITSVMGSVSFTLNGAGTNPSPTIASSGFSTFIVDSNGVPQVDNTNTSPQWQIQHTGTAMTFCTICAGSNNNKEMIIGAPNANNVYSAANNSIAKTTGPHNPFIIGGGGSYGGNLAGLDTTPSWVFSVPTMTATTTVSSVVFAFGSDGSVAYEQDDFTTPEPGPMICVSAGLGLIALGMRKRRSRQK